MPDTAPARSPGNAPPPWLRAALDYLPRWLAHQMRIQQQVGCVLAVAWKGRVVFEQAFGQADLALGEKLTPRHRMRVASHSKSFTAAGLLKLREQGHLHLDQRVGDFVPGLPADLARRATVGQLLMHSAGLVRDGGDGGQWTDRRPFLREAELRADLARGFTLEPNTRFKYSNHGYGLAGLVIEAITKQPYARWIEYAIARPAGLAETQADAPLAPGSRFARGHSAVVPLGRRVVIPCENPTHAMAPATGFIATAADLARWFASLAPDARHSVLDADSRREMLRPQWREPHATLPRNYGLGIISGTLADWEWFGHSGGFQGTITRSACVPAQGLSVSLLTNAADGQAHPWLDGCLQVLRTFQRRGAPPPALAHWAGRWWTLWGAVDLVPVQDRVLIANPALPSNPFMDAGEIAVAPRARGRERHGLIALANGYASHGEPAVLHLDARGRPSHVQLGSFEWRPEARVARELRQRYTPAAAT